MAGRGLRSILQPVLFVGIASLLHGLLFLLPGGGAGKRDIGTTRGVRVKAYVDRPAVAAPPSSPPAPAPRAVPQPPPPVEERHYSALGSRTASGESKDIGSRDSGARPQGASTAGEGGPSQASAEGRQGPPSQSEYGQFLDKLHSTGVQGWAKESAQKQRQGWKGAGAGRGADGWEKRSRTAEGGSGKGGSGKGSGGDGATFMDPRVRMVITSYPPTGIERRYTPVGYPELKFKKHEYTSGWWNVYIEIRTDSDGKMIRCDVLRPETNGPLERQFVSQVKKEIDKWTFDPKEAEIHVDVRFYVE